MVQNWNFPPQDGILCTQSPDDGVVLKAVEIGGEAWMAEVDHWEQAFDGSDLSFSACCWLKYEGASTWVASAMLPCHGGHESVRNHSGKKPPLEVSFVRNPQKCDEYTGGSHEMT